LRSLGIIVDIVSSIVGCVAHASVRRMPGSWELEGDGWRIKLQTELTWLANCMRRILAKLMMAVAVEWRAEVV